MDRRNFLKVAGSTLGSLTMTQAPAEAKNKKDYRRKIRKLKKQLRASKEQFRTSDTSLSRNLTNNVLLDIWRFWDRKHNHIIVTDPVEYAIYRNDSRWLYEGKLGYMLKHRGNDPDVIPIYKWSLSGWNGDQCAAKDRPRGIRGRTYTNLGLLGYIYKAPEPGQLPRPDSIPLFCYVSWNHTKKWIDHLETKTLGEVPWNSGVPNQPQRFPVMGYIFPE